MTSPTSGDSANSESFSGLTKEEELHARATAFVFGELQNDAAIAFMKEMDDSPELLATVESIRQTIESLKTEFAADTPNLSEADRQRVSSAMSENMAASGSNKSETSKTIVPPPPVVNAAATGTIGSAVGHENGASGSGRKGWIAAALAACVLLVGGLTLPNWINGSRSAEDASIAQLAALKDQNRKLLEQQAAHDTEIETLKSELETRTAEANATQGQSSVSSGQLTDQEVKLARDGSDTAGQAAQYPSNLSLVVPVKEKTAGLSEEVFGESSAEMAGQNAPAVIDEALVTEGLVDADSLELSTGSSTGPNTGRGFKPRSRDEGFGDLESEEDMMSMDMDMGMSMDGMGMTDRMGLADDVSMYDMMDLTDNAASDMPMDMMGGGMMEADAFVGDGEMGGAAMGGRRGSVASKNGRQKFQSQGSQSQGSYGPANGVALDGLNTELNTNLSFLSGARVSDMVRTRRIRGPATGDRFAAIHDNPFRRSSDKPLSTFSIDVDTASYSKMRMYLAQHNRLPSPESIRIEEMLNYFDYDYALPTDEHPFSASMQIATCPWNTKHRLARIGIKGREIQQDRPSSNLVFLLDVSGSMDRANKLPLVIDGMKKLVRQLTENDSVAIVVYAGAAGLVLDSTTGDRKKTIIESLDRLEAGGSTNGAQGIQLAYNMARDNFIVGGTNRVILCTDGDFNVGITGTKDLVDIAAENAKGNIFLSVLGYGIGNHNDAMMEKISNKGNGNYAFIDSAAESEKVLVDQMQGTLVTIAKDVKIQVEFNPAEVVSYRLIGYENRVMAAKDFANDKKDAGEIGAGHTVTALYQLVPAVKAKKKTKNVAATFDDIPLRYQSRARLSERAESGELLTLNLRYKQPTGDTSTLLTFPINDDGKTFSQADQDFQFAASVAAFGMLLRNSPHKGDANFDSVEELAAAGAQDDKTGYRKEFVDLVKRAKQLTGQK